MVLAKCDIGSVRIHPAFCMRPLETLIRLGRCPEFPESSLNENSKWFVLSCLGKYTETIKLCRLDVYACQF